MIAFHCRSGVTPWHSYRTNKPFKEGQFDCNAPPVGSITIQETISTEQGQWSSFITNKILTPFEMLPPPVPRYASQNQSFCKLIDKVLIFRFEVLIIQKDQNIIAFMIQY